jgi:hypothetical protein
MTPGSIENEFSNLLQGFTTVESHFDLTIDGPLFCRDHPKVVWAKLQHQQDPHQEIPEITLGGRYFKAYPSPEEARKAYPSIQTHFYGQPWAVHRFLLSGNEDAIIDFGPLGTAVLGHHKLPDKSQHPYQNRLLSAWLPYALSPELWGPMGKWTRFHARLRDLFLRHDLFLDLVTDAPAYYALKSKAEILREHGFVGSSLDKSYLIVLPWTFSLSGLEKLERIVQQEL